MTPFTTHVGLIPQMFPPAVVFSARDVVPVRPHRPASRALNTPAERTETETR